MGIPRLADSHIFFFMQNFCVILAGGTGTRLWPLSQEYKPKQFLDLAGVGRTMLQLTYDRFRPIFTPDRFIVVTLAAYRHIVEEQLRAVQAQYGGGYIFRRVTGKAGRPYVNYGSNPVRSPDLER